MSSQQGERRVLRTSAAAAAAARHHRTAGQGVGRQTDYHVPSSAASLPSSDRDRRHPAYQRHQPSVTAVAVKNVSLFNR